MSGLFSALYLRQRGWEVDVFERTTVALTGRGAGIMTHPAMLAALTSLGLDPSRISAAARKRGELHAYVDGALTPARSAEVGAYLSEHPEDAARIAAYREQIAALRREYDSALNEPLPRRKVARRSKTTLPSGRVTVTSTADSFDTLKRSATGSSSAPTAGPSYFTTGGSTW